MKKSMKKSIALQLVSLAVDSRAFQGTLCDDRADAPRRVLEAPAGAEADQ
jgi:hypothetical protein